MADGRVAIAALLALDDLRVDVAADDGSRRDFEIVGAIDVRRDVAGDARRRQQSDLRPAGDDVVADGAADSHRLAEAVHVDADAAVDLDVLTERSRVARDVRVGRDFDVVGEAVEVTADADVRERQVFCAGEHAAADRALDRDSLGARHQIAG